MPPASSDIVPLLEALSSQIEGELHWDESMRLIYATDASIYRELPIAVCLPKTVLDAKRLIAFASQNALPLIPRTAGTSLAGQVVGTGIIVDVSKYWTNILEIDPNEQWIRVQPGVVRDELNQYLKPHGLMFAPETSTSNRCMIGGMAGNNSCGTHSLIYGSTRDHILEINAILSDGSECTFQETSVSAFKEASQGISLESKILRHLVEIVSSQDTLDEIAREYPHPEIHRRNTGYAIDLFAKDWLRGRVNPAKLLCGSEGTLAFFTELKLKLVPLPPKEHAVVAVHLQSLPQAARATIVAREFRARAIELIDDVILNCSKQNIEQASNRDFVKGDPGALLVVELASDTQEDVQETIDALRTRLRQANLGHDFSTVWNEKIDKVWALRNAGLGVMSNIKGDPKPVAGIEDTAIRPQDLPQYVDAFLEIMNSRGVKSVSYAHIGDGEIHFRPILDLKSGKDRKLYREICEDVAVLVKRFKGSLSGEHGDGRARAEFIRQMIGDSNYQLCIDIKNTWDPEGIFNPGKIVHAPPIDSNLRYQADQTTKPIDTVFDFSDTGGILRMAEKCNGTGACRKTEKTGGTMCPSYMATRDEKDTTRARANILREFLTHSPRENKFDHQEIKSIMDLCLSCKGCKSECPSNVDVTRLKAEFQHAYYQSHDMPFSTKAIGNIATLYKWGHRFQPFANLAMSFGPIARKVKERLNIAPQRSLPKFSPRTLRKWAGRNLPKINPPTAQAKKRVYLFCDEYTNYTDAHIGIKAISLLCKLGYHVTIPNTEESGRAFFSKGMLLEAKAVANANTNALKDRISKPTPLLGIEPSAILGFRDEYPDIVDTHLKSAAKAISPHCLLIDEFISNEIKSGAISTEAFTDAPAKILLHGHCHQKALSSVEHSKALLECPENYRVEIVPSGCCGMAGAFGYETQHYDISQQVGELVLYPAIRKSTPNTLIAATGTSCRHQIKDGVKRTALHPIEILHDALSPAGQ